MPNAEWINNVTEIVKRSMKTEGMCDVIMGTVISASPLKIQIDPDMEPVSAKQLLLTRNVSDYTTEMNIPEVGQVRATVKNGLKAGENVILLQRSGAQQFVILDRW